MKVRTYSVVCKRRQALSDSLLCVPVSDDSVEDDEKYDGAKYHPSCGLTSLYKGVNVYGAW
jgi:hypothetical protein